MARYISKINLSKVSTAKHLGNPMPGDKYLGIESAINLYEIEDGDNNEEEEDTEIFIIQDKSLPETKQNLVKSKLSFIDKFDHTVSAVVRVMHDLTHGVFEHLEITPPLDVDRRVNYTQNLLRGPVLKNYKTVMAECKDPSKGISGDQWTLSATKYVTMEQLWTWTKIYGVEGSEDMYLLWYRCLDFEKYICFELGKSMRKKHWSVFQDHVK